MSITHTSRTGKTYYLHTGPKRGGGKVEGGLGREPGLGWSHGPRHETRVGIAVRLSRGAYVDKR